MLITPWLIVSSDKNFVHHFENNVNMDKHLLVGTGCNYLSSGSDKK